MFGMSTAYSGYIPQQRSLERRERQNAHISLLLGKVLPVIAYPVLVIGAVKSFNLSGVSFLVRLTYPLANWTYQNVPLLWKCVPYPDVRTALVHGQPLAFEISLLCWVSWFIGLVLICKGLVKKSASLYVRSADRKRNIGIHEAVKNAMHVQGNTFSVSGIDNSVSATNTINNYESQTDKDWKLKAGLWLAITGAAGNFLAGFLTELFKRL
jgi:hypothetical protein